MSDADTTVAAPAAAAAAPSPPAPPCPAGTVPQAGVDPDEAQVMTMDGRYVARGDAEGWVGGWGLPSHFSV